MTGTFWGVLNFLKRERRVQQDPTLTVKHASHFKGLTANVIYLKVVVAIPERVVFDENVGKTANR